MSLPVMKRENTSLEKDNDDTVILEDRISLKQFPPQLRKLGKYLMSCTEEVSISDACQELGLNRSAVHTQIWRAKKKGNDFTRFLGEITETYLDMSLYDVDRALVKGAVSDSHADRKLYYQRIGKLTESPQINTNITLNMGFIPASSGGQDTRKSGVIDTKPFVPSLPDKSK